MINVLIILAVGFSAGFITGAVWLYYHIYVVIAHMNIAQLNHLADDVVAEKRANAK